MADENTTNVAAGILKEVILSLLKMATKEAHYLCCYKTYVEAFEEQRSSLPPTVERVRQDINEARNTNENQIDPQVQHWLNEAEDLIQHDTKTKKKWPFGLCTNCCWQYRRGKELERKTQRIKELVDTSNFAHVARSTGLPDIEYHSSSQNFIHFESRKSKFEQLMKALEEENMHVIGMKGMGGIGKTTMAIEVGEQVKKSMMFDKVILSVVSKDPNEKKIREGIANHMGLEFKEGMEESNHAELLWKRIAEGGEKALIILDDVWEVLNFKDIGIKPGRHEYANGFCSVLLTTRNMEVCRGMNCQKTIELEDLSAKDALNLFLFHAGTSGNDCSDDSKVVALDIVKECGRLPVAIVAVANTLKNWPSQDWQAALTLMKNSEPLKLGIVNEYETKVYNSLQFSYDHLNDRNAQDFLLLCSLFPEDYEIPIELITRIAIGLGLCGEVDKYYIARSHVPAIKNKLINSSLLLKAENESIKMHDLVREVALQWIANKEIQVILDSKTSLKENVRYSFWNIDDFLTSCFDGSKLEALLVWINAMSSKKDPVPFFEGMKSLRVLILIHMKYRRLKILPPSFVRSIQLLTNLRTLIIKGWKLGDISIVRNLQSLETFELTNCSMNELPNEISELKRLRLMDLRYCVIDRNNPFEVIERCQWLEELYYVENTDVLFKGNDGELQERTLPILQRYNIQGSGSFISVDPSLSRCFCPLYLKNVFSEATFKSLATRAEALGLGFYNETGWTNVIPDIVHMEDEGVKDLIMLYLRYCPEIKCVICTDNLRSDSNLTIFTKLVKLSLIEMKAKELCCGPFPVDFLKKLKILHLRKCLNLEGTLFGGKLELGYLKSIEFEDCSMTSLFHPSTAKSLKQLERLLIRRCGKLKYIISDERSREEKADHHDPNQRSQGFMLPKLRFMWVEGCDELEFILPICFVEDLPLLKFLNINTCKNLKYIFGQYPKPWDLYQMGKEIILSSLTKMEISGTPNFVDIYIECYLPRSSPTTSDVWKAKDESCRNNSSWERPLCCFQPKTSRDNPSDSKVTQLDPTTSQELKTKWVCHTPQRALTPPLYPHNLRKLKIKGFPNLTSLFTMSIASSMLLLERLAVEDCKELKHLVTDDRDGHHHMNCDSLFPNLQEVSVSNCGFQEPLFPASLFRSFKNLEVLRISNAHELRYVFGNCCCKDNLASQNSNAEIDHLDLPALKELHLEDVPNMVSICMENYYLMPLSPQKFTLKGCPTLPIRLLTDCSIGEKERQDLFGRKAIGMHLQNLEDLDVDNLLEIDTIYDLEGLKIERPMESSLQSLYLKNVAELRYICVGPNNSLSLRNLFKLKITECKKLKVIFSASILRSLPMLSMLNVSDCKELEHIIEENEQNSDHSHELCFPQLSNVILINLPSLQSIGQGIDFQTVRYRIVCNCPNISLTSTEPMSSQDEGESTDRYQTTITTPNLTEIMETEQASIQERLTSGKAIVNLTKDSELSKKLAPFPSPSQIESPKNIETSVGKGPSREKCDIATSSTHPDSDVPHPGPLTSLEKGS